MKKFGYDVVKEYYINDAGSQIETLVQSLIVRYRNLFGENIDIPEGCYPGEYLIDIALKLKELYPDLSKVDKRALADFAINEIMELIKNDLRALGVIHDVFISEFHDIIEKNKVQIAIKKLEDKKLIYKGILEAPKGISDSEWEPKEQTIFKSTSFGDDADRPIIKSDGSYTYFLGDIAYHDYKLARGFDHMILLLGADHGGYVKRIKSIVKALSDGKANIEVKINQLVNLYKDGKPFKMSKRAGNFITVKDVIDEIGKDAFRFAILTKKSDTVLDIDFTKMKEQSKDNPLFYVQYAHARAKSVLRKALSLGIGSDLNVNLEGNIFEEDLSLIKSIASLPKVLLAALTYCEPHRINYYLQDLANHFHHLWSLGMEQKNLRFIFEQDVEATKARITLVVALVKAIALSLELLGIKALDEM